MISYFNDGNYYGDNYHKYLEKRREANDFWISTFYPIDIKDLLKIRQIINKLIVDCGSSEVLLSFYK